jgi:hypothetical protein
VVCRVVVCDVEGRTEEVDVVCVADLPSVDDELVLLDTTALLVKAELVLLTDEETEVSLYISSLFPAPQYSYWFPGQVNEQSVWVVARTEVESRMLPQ